MEIISLRTTADLPLCPATVTALGLFDGVHRGHRLLLERTVAEARHCGCASAVLTFDDASDSLKPGSPRLSDTADRLSLIAACGIEYAFVADFASIRSFSPERFVGELLVGACRTRLAVCGFNFRFGAGAAGTAETLSRLMKRHGGTCLTIPALKTDSGTVISSSAVRTALTNGDAETAAAMLGREFSIAFPVVHGFALGRKLGVPTVNQVFPPHFVVPARGVYAVVCEVDGKVYPGVANVGQRPTVGGTTVNCETHIIGFSGWLYGQRVRIRFLRYLRGEIKFGSLDALRGQIQNDIDKVKEIWLQPNGQN